MIDYTIEQRRNMIKITKYHIEKHPDAQIEKAKEEMKELKDELDIYLETLMVTEKLLDELFDADFMIFQLKRMFLDNKMNQFLYQRVVNAKIKRELKRNDL